MSKAITSPRVTQQPLTEEQSITSPPLKPHSTVPPFNIKLTIAYVIDWTATQVQWIIDGVVVRTLLASDVGAKFPQTPSQVRIGTWCGG